uniref:NADH-ubiquinone oxidoreductase chain 2 n=1 Tax=Trigonopterus triradiatus TaxID=2678947 RepID=A0A7H1KHW6_9CUCU|nr:NADH dehydrogenase subunit 2 [Trigonopterus triradiatus]QNT26882.1 NADH dehydrogenase subunit 2 [Trigonopterus triradiatus]
MINFYKILFSNLLVSSTLISISSITWFSAWIGLEMNLLSMLPLMKTHNNNLAAEASIKYFIVQAMASATLLFSIVLFSNLNFFNFNSSPIASMMVNLALILKMGAAPLHFWLPEIVSGLKWAPIFTLLTWQKIAPMILLSYSMKSVLFISMIIVLSSLISGVQGMNQVCLRKIMAYSSINHMGWMMCTLMGSINLWFYYFVIYSLTTLNILLVMNKFRLFYFTQLNKLFTYNKPLKFFFMLNFISLGGLPPFSGFLPKWMTINLIISLNYQALGLALISLTLLSLFFYCRLTFSSLTFNLAESLISTQINKLSSLFFLFNLSTLSILPLSFAIAQFY